MRTLAGCDLPEPLKQGSVELLALGDFAASNESAEILPLDAKGATLKFPAATLAVEARVVGAQRPFIGYAESLQRARFDVLLWQQLTTCEVFRPDGAQGYPGRFGGQALGYAPELGLVLAAGGNDVLVSNAVVGGVSFDVSTGALSAFDTSHAAALREARAFATSTAFRDKLLVAGGENPAYGVADEDIEPLKTAEIFDPAQGGFAGEPIVLKDARTRHAALVLQSGDTLLVGGRNRVGDSNVALRPCELISVETGRAKPVATLASERIFPRALRLSDGRVFVGGGTTLAGTAADPAGEWLSADGLEQLAETDDSLPPRHGRAFVAMPGGGVLAVGGCETSDCSTQTSFEAYWLDRDGAVTALPLERIAAPRPILLPGSDGSPWLVAARQDEPDTPRLFRFDPWSRRFTEADAPAGLRLPRAGFPEPVAIAPDAFVWIDDRGARGALFGLRLGTRNRYSRDVALVLASEPRDPSRPLHLVPDRPLQGDERYDGRLWLSDSAGERGVTVWVADTDYADVRVAVRLAAPDPALGVPESAPPRVVLGDVELGAGYCPWPAGDARGGDADVPTVVRRGTRAELRYRGASRPCSVPGERASIALRAGAGTSVVTELVVQRGGR